ncbi:MAG: MerR family transcriptional regulator [Chloroflexota bacterium]
MKISDQAPTFNLKVVVQETGLKPDTLRAWERRYGVPNPQRTAGGHRLYSKQDIDTLLWLVARQKEGLSISRAVDLWYKLMEENEASQETALEEQVSTPNVVSAPAKNEAITQLCNSWVEACLEFDEQQAEQLLAQAFARYPMEMVCFDVLKQGLSTIGQGWYNGTVTVQQEHFASALALRRLETLLVAAPSPTRPTRILVSCPPEEDHTFSPLLLTLLLRYQGWHVFYLGANVPVEKFVNTLKSTQAKLVVLSAQSLYTASTLLDIAEVLETEQVTVAYGGLIFNRKPGLQDYIPGHFLGEQLEVVTQSVSQLLSTPLRPSAPKKRSELYKETMNQYQAGRLIIEAEVEARIQDSTLSLNHLRLLNNRLSNNLMAALKLGDVNFFESDIKMLFGILTDNQISIESLQTYLAHYHQSVNNYLGHVETPINTWFDQVTA